LIYVNGNLYKDVTPAQIENLNPGAYKIMVKREGFYQWEEELVVRPNMVTKADSIILFPVMQEMTRINDQPCEDFVLSERGYIYYFAASGLYRSEADGFNLKKISSFSKWPKKMLKKKISPEADKILCFNDKEIVIAYLNSERVEDVLTTEEPIIDVFWYTGSGYIIVVTEKYINVLELRSAGKRNIATLYKFSTQPHCVSYDPNNGSLYFMDRAKDNFSKDGVYIYRIDLRQKFFDYLMQVLLKRESEAPNEKR
jgi:hypothetical protein